VVLQEMENVMERKLTLFGILGIVVLLALSTMGSVRYQRVPRVSSSLAAPAMACLPDSSANGFRSDHLWNNRFIPAVDVTASLTNTAKTCAPGESAENFRFAHIWNGYLIPSMDVTASLTGSAKGYLPAAAAPSLVSLNIPNVFSGH
jgi:hypothetical protein